MQPVKLNLSKAQARKLMSGNRVRVSREKMGTGIHTYQLSPAQAKKMQRAFNTGKGMDLQMTRPQVEHCLKNGEGLWDWVKSAASTVGHAAQPLIRKAATALKPYAKKALQEGVTLGADALGVPEFAGIANKGASYAFDAGAKELGVGAGSAAMRAKMAKVRASKTKHGRGGLYV